MSPSSMRPSPLASSSAKPEASFCLRKSESTGSSPLSVASMNCSPGRAPAAGSLYRGAAGPGRGDNRADGFDDRPASGTVTARPATASETTNVAEELYDQ